jgi:PHD/YefM family antitoxin component YafN of YafNO toxin-antitoxin module
MRNDDKFEMLMEALENATIMSYEEEDTCLSNSNKFERLMEALENATHGSTRKRENATRGFKATEEATREWHM